MTNVSELFKTIYNRAPSDVAFCPYRICPVGAHVDHQQGKIIGFALDKGIYFAYSPKQNGVIELASLNFDKRAQFFVGSVPSKKQNDWADHLRGATIALSKRYNLKIGVCGIFYGELPIGGLSSSAAVIIAFLSALCSVNEITLSKNDMVTIAREAENEYVGVSCGILDQSCEVYCQKDKLLYLDTKDNSYELIPTNANLKPYDIVIFFSGKERSLASSKFNSRVNECSVSAYFLKAKEGMEYDDVRKAYLRDVPYEVFKKYEDVLPENFKKRCTHFYTENIRVEKAAEYWRKGDIEGFGKCCFESGKSSIVNYETGSPELIELYDLIAGSKGVYGGRFSGAGFQGCCLAITNPEYTEEIIKNVSANYLKKFPALSNAYRTFICKTADGVKL